MEFGWGDFMKHHLNHVCFERDGQWLVFERFLGKDYKGDTVDFSIYPDHRNLGVGTSSDEAIRNSTVPNWDIEVIS